MQKKLVAHISLFLAATIWGMMAPIGKAAMTGGVSALSLASMRMFGGALCFWLVSLFVRREKVAGRDLVRLFFASLLGIVLNQGAYTFGLSLTSPVDASIIVTIMPVITMVLSAVFLKEPLTMLKSFGVFLGLSGAVLLVTGNSSGSIGTGSVTGNLLCLSASFSFACYLTIFKELIHRYSVITLMKWMFLYAALCFMPVAWTVLPETLSAGLPLSVWLEVGYVVLFGTFVAYIFMLVGQQVLRPTVVSMYNYVQPVISTLVSVLMGLAVLGLVKVFAALLIFTGVYCVTKSKSRADMMKK